MSATLAPPGADAPAAAPADCTPLGDSTWVSPAPSSASLWLRDSGESGEGASDGHTELRVTARDGCAFRVEMQEQGAAGVSYYAGVGASTELAVMMSLPPDLSEARDQYEVVYISSSGDARARSLSLLGTVAVNEDLVHAYRRTLVRQASNAREIRRGLAAGQTADEACAEVHGEWENAGAFRVTGANSSAFPRSRTFDQLTLNVTHKGGCKVVAAVTCAPKDRSYYNRELLVGAVANARMHALETSEKLQARITGKLSTGADGVLRMRYTGSFREEGVVFTADLVKRR